VCVVAAVVVVNRWVEIWKLLILFFFMQPVLALLELNGAFSILCDY
jgi:hypothetical protein